MAVGKAVAAKAQAQVTSKHWFFVIYEFHAMPGFSV
jgi:hypothetical protein